MSKLYAERLCSKNRGTGSCNVMLVVNMLMFVMVTTCQSIDICFLTLQLS